MTTSHAYGACRNALAYVAERAGAQLVVAEVPFPLAAEDELVEPILGSLTARTRLLVVDHVTSPSGLVLPVERIARAGGRARDPGARRRCARPGDGRRRPRRARRRRRRLLRGQLPQVDLCAEGQRLPLGAPATCRRACIRL